MAPDKFPFDKYLSTINATILLLDEPLVNLDYKLREQLREEFKNIFSQGLSEESISR